MKTRPFFWHILPSFLLISGLSCILLLIYTTKEFKQFFLDHTVSELKTRAILFDESICTTPIGTHDSLNKAINTLAKRIGRKTKTRYSVILAGGLVIADSDEEPSAMDNHGNRPEVISALEGDTGVSVRHSATLSRDLVYVALPLVHNDSIYAILRASIPVISLSERMGTFSKKLFIAGLIIIIVSVLVSIVLSQRLSKSLILLKNLADKFAKGDFQPVSFIRWHTEETAMLAQSMDAMAKQLDERIKTITSQKNEQKAILSAMVEGVVAVDLDEHIIMINEAAGMMFNIEIANVTGKWVQESIRHRAFQKFVRELLDKKTTRKQEIVISADVERIIEIQGTALQGTQDSITRGVLFVLHDVTHLKKLERVRSDFVSNVSHELRTPLTSIKGFVETLQDGAKNKKESMDRFLKIIESQVNRLNSLIEDLLTLSRLEKDGTIEEIIVEEVASAEVIKNAIEVCADKAQAKEIILEVTGDKKTSLFVNISLMEQALINLIDNAVKYSDECTKVTISIEQVSNEVTLIVADQGHGIAREHLPRIFERFYRIDKARSKKMGGTGLGLSIVKHIVNLHKGSVSVESKEGKGSTFTIRLPRVLG